MCRQKPPKGGFYCSSVGGKHAVSVCAMITLASSNLSDLLGFLLTDSNSSDACSQSSGAPIAIKLSKMWYIK